MTVHVSAPGKLFLSGEWAILDVGNKGLVAAVDRRVHAEVSASPDDSFYLELVDFAINVKASFDGKVLKFDGIKSADEKKLKFAKGAIEAALRYFKGKTPLRIKTWGEDLNLEVNGQNKKIGFGSSAAAVVAIVGGIFSFMRKPLYEVKNLEYIYKLSAIAHFLSQGKLGSGFDVAASTYGGVFVYSRFDPSWLLNRVVTEPITSLVEAKWPGFSVKSLGLPSELKLLVGWTKESASSAKMLKDFNEWKKEGSGQMYLSEIANVASKAISAWSKNDRAAFLDALRFNRHLLRELGQVSGVPIETTELKKLADIAEKYGAAGKLSGAGGGDCGIAVTYDEETAKQILKAWEAEGILPLDVALANEGLREES